MQANSVNHSSKVNTFSSQTDEAKNLITQLERNSYNYNQLDNSDKKELINSHKNLYNKLSDYNKTQFQAMLRLSRNINGDFRKDLLAVIDSSKFFNPDEPVGQSQPLSKQNVNIVNTSQTTNINPELFKPNPGPEETSMTNASINPNKNSTNTNKGYLEKVLNKTLDVPQQVVHNIKDELSNKSLHVANKANKLATKPIESINKNIFGNPVRYAEKYHNFYKNEELPLDADIESLKKGFNAIKKELGFILYNNSLEFTKDPNSTKIIGRKTLYQDTKHNYKILVKTEGSSIIDSKHEAQILVQNGDEPSAFRLAIFKGLQEYINFLSRIKELANILNKGLIV